MVKLYAFIVVLLIMFSSSCSSRKEEDYDFTDLKILKSYLIERIDPNTGEIISSEHPSLQECLVIEIIQNMANQKDLLTIYKGGQVIFQSKVVFIANPANECGSLSNNSNTQYNRDSGEPLFFVSIIYGPQGGYSIFSNFITDNGNSIVDCSLRTYFK